MVENLIVWSIVLVVAALTVRSIRRSWRGEKGACNCADGCPMTVSCGKVEKEPEVEGS